jgi:SAM-dependent methyltransferase
MSIYETIDLSAERYNRHETHDDVEFILSVIGEQPKRVLEVGCGYGRILLALADAGHDVTGIDVEDGDLDNLSATAKSLGIKNVHWRKEDAVHGDWGTGFDVVVLAGNILFNIENIESGTAYKKAQESFIQKAASALVPSGHVYIGYSPFAPNGRTLVRPGQSCTDDGSIFGTWEFINDDGSIDIDSLTPGSFDEETGVLRFKKFTERRTPDGKVIKEETERMKHYATLEHIHQWLADAGFIIELECEGFDKAPINDDSREVIIYARKK